MAASVAAGLPLCGPLLSLHADIMMRQGMADQVAMSVYCISPSAMTQMQQRPPPVALPPGLGPVAAQNNNGTTQASTQDTNATVPPIAAMLSSLEAATAAASAAAASAAVKLPATNEGGDAAAMASAAAAAAAASAVEAAAGLLRQRTVTPALISLPSTRGALPSPQLASASPMGRETAGPSAPTAAAEAVVIRLLESGQVCVILCIVNSIVFPSGQIN